MHRCRSVFAATLFLSAALFLRGGLLEWLFGKNGIQVIAVTDMTPAGRQQTRPTPEHPEYFIPLSLGFQDLGGLVGGEKEPPKDEVLRAIFATLGRQGYLPATETSPAPTIALVFAWGTLNADYDYGMNPDAPPRQLNRQQIVKFLGGAKAGLPDSEFDPFTSAPSGFTLMKQDAREFYEAAADDYYVAVVSAYDLAAIKRKEKKLLWMTRMACPARGFWLADTLPTMLEVGGPLLGQETDRPVWFRADDPHRAVVKLGELQFLDDAKAPPPTTIELESGKPGAVTPPKKKK